MAGGPIELSEEQKNALAVSGPARMLKVSAGLAVASVGFLGFAYFLPKSAFFLPFVLGMLAAGGVLVLGLLAAIGGAAGVRVAWEGPRIPYPRAISRGLLLLLAGIVLLHGGLVVMLSHWEWHS